MEAAGPERDPLPSCAHATAQRSRTAPRPNAPLEAGSIAPDPRAPESPDTPATWSDDAVEQLHEGLLRHALQALHARGNAPLKQEVLRWIFCPQAMVLTLPGAEGRPRSAVLPQQCTPFSFEQCCRVCGYSPQRLRDGLAALLPAIGLADTLAQITRASIDATAHINGISA